jgi:hypothetical protein
MEAVSLPFFHDFELPVQIYLISCTESTNIGRYLHLTLQTAGKLNLKAYSPDVNYLYTA